MSSRRGRAPNAVGRGLTWAATWVRSAGVGLVATALDLLSLAILVNLLGLEPTHANVPALALGVLVQFVGNKWFAFEDTSKEYVRQGTAFALVELGAFALNAGAFHLLVTATAVPALLARVISSAVVYFGFSYPLWRRIFGRCARVGTCTQASEIVDRIQATSGSNCR